MDNFKTTRKPRYTEAERKAVLAKLDAYEREVLLPAERRERALDPTFNPAHLSLEGQVK